MYLMPHSHNILPGATLSPSLHRYEPRFPPANMLSDADLRLPMLGLGAFRTATYLHIDFDEELGGGEMTATIKTTLIENPAALCAEAALKMNAAGTLDYYWRWRQDSTARYRFELIASDTVALKPNSGTNTATSALRYLMGFRSQDRAAAATHLGDLSVVHNPLAGDAALWDMTTATTAQAAVIVNPFGSRGLRPRVDMGTDTSVNDFQQEFGDFDDELMATFFATPQTYRYAQILFRDPHREDALAGLGCGAGYFYLGPYLNLDNFTWSTYSEGQQVMSHTQTGTTGLPFVSELRPGRTFSVGFSAQPGLTSADATALQDMVFALGTQEKITIAFDPTNDPSGSTRCCRLTSAPTFQHIYDVSKAGRWTCGLEFEVLAVK